MFHRLFWIPAALFTLVAVTGTACAGWARFHYVPMDSSGNLALKPSDGTGGFGERVTWFGMTRTPSACPPRATCVVSFRHPCTGCPIKVPLALPEDTPIIQHRAERVIYNYGSYAVEVHFLPDGSVDVIYNSGLLRDIRP